MNCVLCNKPICNHGRLSIKDDVFTCLDCGAIAIGKKPSVIILPVFESHFDVDRGLPSPICASCYTAILKTWLEWAIDIINGYDQRLATFDDPKLVYSEVHLRAKKTVYRLLEESGTV